MLQVDGKTRLIVSPWPTSCPRHAPKNMERISDFGLQNAHGLSQMPRDRNRQTRRIFLKAH
jgi:hypothetical protein